MFILKKQGKCLELPLLLYIDGIKKIKFRLLELHQEFADIVNMTFYKFLIKKDMYQKEEKLLIVESSPKSSLMSLTDKSIFINPLTLIMKWSKILGAILTLKEKDCKTFWNKSCKDRSPKLWFPIETDYVGSHSNLLSGSSVSTVQNSWFSIKQSINPLQKNSPMTFCQSFKSSPVESWKSEGIRVRKLRLMPSVQQKQLFERWAGTTRYVYNKCLHYIKQQENKPDYYKIRDEFITEKGNNIITDAKEESKFSHFIYDWELNTPKDIRCGALRDIKKAFKSAFSNLKNGNIRSFGLNDRKKKYGNNQSMEIPNSAIKLIKYKNCIKGLQIYPSYSKEVIKIDKRSLKGVKLDSIDKFCRLKKENGNWILCVPYIVKSTDTVKKTKTCAIDPGIRDAYVIYSEAETVAITPNHKLINKFYNRIDLFKSLRAKKLIKSRTANKRTMYYESKLKNLVDDMQHKTIKFLTDTYSHILLPTFETQDMVGSNKLAKIVKRKMMTFSSYKFQQRLIHKCSLLKYCDVIIVNEAYTSQTCGYCGNLKKTSDKTIHCDSCNKTFDRDINGARNIYLKYTK